MQNAFNSFPVATGEAGDAGRVRLQVPFNSFPVATALRLAATVADRLALSILSQLLLRALAAIA
jgi:hypothetical protein